jgi:hypothetical protein
MEIFESMEARWFFDDEASAAAARAWFAGVEPEGWRVDRYLITDRADLGFKARLTKGRPAKVETKYLVGSLGAVALAERGRVVGSLERWRKLSLDLDDPSLQKQGTWLALEKDRRLRKYAWEASAVRRVESGDPSLRLEGAASPDAGCGVELTELRFDLGGARRVAWTFGLEAFGPPGSLLDVFMSAAREIFASASGVTLPARLSESYPRWLERTARSGPAAEAAARLFRPAADGGGP